MKIRYLISGNGEYASNLIEEAALEYDGIGEDRVAEEIRALGADLLEAFLKNREKISEDMVDSEIIRLRNVFDRRIIAQL